jgi:hypothetical protein
MIQLEEGKWASKASMAQNAHLMMYKSTHQTQGGTPLELRLPGKTHF